MRVAALETELAALRRRVELLETLAQQDDWQFLHGIARVVHDTAFTTRELFRHRTVDADLRRVLCGVSLRELGARLRRLRDRPLGGVVLRRIGREAAGSIWRVYVAADMHADR